ncbi:MAG: PEP-CTERM sorting domain-containing protein [Pirellulaceae bacterium]|nr:PEP-CTERM sorting domain-containing protein [Pirellulaceae bacterium]
MNAKYFGCVLTIAALLMGTNLAQAETISEVLFSENFDSYNTGELAGQVHPLGTWANQAENWNGSVHVIADPRDANSKVMASGTLADGASRHYGAQLMFANDGERDDRLVFTPADSNVEVNFSFAINKNGTTVATTRFYVNMFRFKEDGTKLGAAADGGAGSLSVNTDKYSGRRALLGQYNGVSLHGDTFTNNVWYEAKVIYDFSVPGVSATYKYREQGDTEWITDGALHDANLNLPSNEDGNYVSAGIFFYVGSFNTSPQYGFVDDISIVRVVPEPGTLALLTCGLFGLAAYAWRKRRQQ